MKIASRLADVGLVKCGDYAFVNGDGDVFYLKRVKAKATTFIRSSCARSWVRLPGMDARHLMAPHKTISRTLC
jgi:hypothetical protein